MATTARSEKPLRCEHLVERNPIRRMTPGGPIVQCGPCWDEHDRLIAELRRLRNG